MPDEIKLISALGTAYAVFPSKESAKKILYASFLKIISFNFFKIF